MGGRTERRRRTQNWILRALPPHDFERLSRRAAPVHFKRGDVVWENEDGDGRVYFMMSGVCSAQLTTSSGESTDVASISCEGVTSVLQPDRRALGTQLIVSVDQTSAWQLSPEDFDAEMDRRGALRALVTEYYRSFYSETLLAIGCSRFHAARARCCTKLLTLADRGGSEMLHITHASLASMLGLTRPSLTVIASHLKRSGVIEYARGALELRDRRALERYACDCYQIIRDKQPVAVK